MTSAIKNLRQAAQHGMLLHVECRKCGHSASFLAADVSKFANPAKPLELIAFRCRICSAKEARVTAAEFDRDRKPDVIVWRPMRLK
ncbi:hypothetical protein MRS76_04420 [Rhizobiaceae bacterium n13]|uniref:Uncharacterized protein n=1 Tax=Ferirhizobium litorale TaxID=2927786 RepID=A0AAE3QCA3_9HYPH|nr:hypothetical protein [Fererhizobium litorale]MDI7861191.1 hypothetical protein [Fererhizobium litorale]MDI7921338.1 hypothetical protein [Fererhizobium litorale]